MMWVHEWSRFDLIIRLGLCRRCEGVVLIIGGPTFLKMGLLLKVTPMTTIHMWTFLKYKSMMWVCKWSSPYLPKKVIDPWFGSKIRHFERISFWVITCYYKKSQKYLYGTWYFMLHGSLFLKESRILYFYSSNDESKSSSLRKITSFPPFFFHKKNK